jgi:hypothetical protein
MESPIGHPKIRVASQVAESLGSATFPCRLERNRAFWKYGEFVFRPRFGTKSRKNYTRIETRLVGYGTRPSPAESEPRGGFASDSGRRWRGVDAAGSGHDPTFKRPGSDSAIH